MPLEPIQLDDLTWSDLTEAARGRIAGVSRGEWTLHAPVDPGITLLELFASQLEQRLYWMDQPSDSLDAALLELIDVRPRGVGVASTVLYFRAHENGGFPRLPCGMVVTPDVKRRGETGNESPAFTTRSELTLLPMWEKPGRRLGSFENAPAVSLVVAGKDRTTELGSGRLPCFFPIDGALREAEIVLWLDSRSILESITVAGGVFSLLFELETPAQIRPQWVDDFAGEDDVAGQREETRWPPSPAEISWSYWDGERYVDFRRDLIEDGTGGLRRSGIVRLPLPDLSAWISSEPAMVSRPVGRARAIPFSVRVRATDATYSYLPRIRSIVPNVVIASHRRRCCIGSPEPSSSLPKRTQDLAKQMNVWRPLPGNELQLPEDEFGDRLLPPGARVRSELRLWERDVLDQRGRAQWRTWNAVDDLTRSGPQDRHFVMDRSSGRLRFGDGLNGRIPIPYRISEPVDEPIHFELEFEVGGGSKGNVAAWLSWRAGTLRSDARAGSPTSREFPWHAVNVVPAAGGRDAETTEQTRRRAASSLARPHRVVTEEDLERLAEATPGVAVGRARAAVGLHPEHPCLPVPGASTVFVVPDLPPALRNLREGFCGDDLTALRPDAGTLAAVAQWLDGARLVTHEIHVRPPIYAEIELRVAIAGVPDDSMPVRHAVATAFHQYLHPLFGGPDGNGWTFGEPLRPSELMRLAQETVDEELRVEEVGIRPFLSHRRHAVSNGPAAGASRNHGCDAPGTNPTASECLFRSCEDFAIAPHALIALRTVQVEFTTDPTRTGGLL